MGRKIVITGAAGFIGSQLAWRLHRLGHDLVLIDDLSYGYRDNLVVDGQMFAELTVMDIRDPSLLDHVRDADCIFHMAAISALPVNQTEPAKAISINVAGTANVLEAARRGNVRRVVFASTSAIYENNTSFPCRENDPVAPTLIYALSKWQAERLCLSFADTYAMEVAITRYYNVYGPHQDVRRQSPPFIGYVLRELLHGRTPILHSNGEQRRDYVYLDDVNALNIACMESPAAPGHIVNVASGQAWSVNEIYARIAGILETDIKPDFRPAGRFWEKYPSLVEGTRPMAAGKLEKEVDKFTLGSTEKAAALLGWTARVGLEEGLRATVDHARKTLVL